MGCKDETLRYTGVSSCEGSVLLSELDVDTLVPCSRSLHVIDTCDSNHSLAVQVHVEGRCPQRSLKYFLGLAQGCWLVSSAWLEACSQAGAWLPEHPFQVKGDHIALGAPEKGSQCLCDSVLTMAVVLLSL